MKKLFLIVVMVMVGVLAFCQSRANSPQTIAWDAAQSDIGAITYEVYLVPVDMTDRSDVNTFHFLGTTILLEMLVDVGVEGLEGDFFVGVRKIRDYNGEVSYSTMSYSDVLEDVDPIYGTFFLRYLRNLVKPKRIRMK